MHRLLVTVIGCEESARRRDPSGLVRASFRLRVKVKGPAIGALEAPGGVVGLEGSLRRDFLLPWAPKRGDLLVLDPLESRRFLCPGGAAARRPASAGKARLFAADVDGDGWEEDVFSNAFMSSAVQPHRGARLLSLVGRDGRDRLSQPGAYIMSGEYVLLGGVEESVVEAGVPGDLWKSPFSREVSASGASVTYARRLKTPDGVTLTREIGVGPDLPGVVEVARLSRAASTPEESAGATDLSLAARMTVPVLGPIGSLTLFEIPSHGELATVRFHRPPHGRRWRWRDWKDEFFGLGAGFLVSRNEREGNLLAWLFAANRSPVVAVRSDFEGPEIMLRYAPVTVKPGGHAEFGAAFLVADAAAVSATSLLLATAGRRAGDAVPVALTLRTSRRVAGPRVALATAAGRRSVALTRRPLPGAGQVHAAVVHVPRASFPIRCSVTLGVERLSCVLEA